MAVVALPAYCWYHITSGGQRNILTHVAISGYKTSRNRCVCVCVCVFVRARLLPLLLALANL